METALTKSFPTMKTGNLSYLSLIYGFVEPFNIFYYLFKRYTYREININCSECKMPKLWNLNTFALFHLFINVQS